MRYVHPLQTRRWEYVSSCLTFAQIRRDLTLIFNLVGGEGNAVSGDSGLHRHDLDKVCKRCWPSLDAKYRYLGT